MKLFYKLKFLVHFSIGCLINIALFGQVNDDLIKTVFPGEFDKKIISEYLNAKDPLKQKTAILAVATSADSSFAAVLIAKANKDNIQEVAFALSRLPYSQANIDFLFNQLSTNKTNAASEQIYCALGKTGSANTLTRLALLYEQKKLPNTAGISLALFHFRQRKVDNSKSSIILSTELLKASSKDALKEALFAIYRLPVDSALLMPIRNLQGKPEIKNADAGTLQYFAGVLRKYRIKPSEEIHTLLSENSDFAVRVESIRLQSALQFSDSSAIKKYLKHFSDTNENVRIQAAQSLTINTVIPKDLKLYTADKLFALLPGNNSSQVKFQILSAILRIEPALSFVVEKHFKNISPHAVTEIVFNFPKLFDNYCKAICKNYSNYPLKDKYIILSNLSGVSKALPEVDIHEFSRQILLSESSPVLLAALFENIDSSLFINMPTEVTDRIKNVVLYNLGNAEYTDCFNALITLSKTFSTEWSQDLIRILKTTSIKSVAEKFGKKTNPSNILEKLNSYLLKYATAVISTTKGDIVVQLNPAIAPVSSANFLSLANQNYFNKIEFHRVVPGFVIQAGDPTGTGSGGPGYEILTELSPFHYKKGTLGMARSDFNTEGSQWFITTGEYYHLDGNYTVFGSVLSGLDVAEKITQDDSIISVSVNDKYLPVK